MLTNWDLIKTHVFIDITRRSITSELTENKEASSTSNLHPLLRPFGKSLAYIKNKRGPTMKPCDTPSQVSTKAGHIKLLLLVKKPFSISIKSTHIPF